MITRSKERGAECISTASNGTTSNGTFTKVDGDVTKVVKFGEAVYLLDSKNGRVLQLDSNSTKLVLALKKEEGTLLDIVAESDVLAVAVKLDVSYVQYQFYSRGERILFDHPLTLPINMHREAFGCFWSGMFICRAGKTGMLKVNLKTKRCEALLGGEELADFRAIPEHNQMLVFRSGRSGNPAKCQVVRLDTGAITAERQFFKADSVQFHPHPIHNACLIVCQTESDASGKSYYGESQLYLYAQARFSLVQLDKAGPVHDVAWNPKEPEFGAAFGFMPARVALFSLDSRVLYTFSPECAVNTLRFHPAGGLLLMGGFGNLAGKLEIWSRSKCRRLLTLEAPGASTLELIGKWLVAATLTPRLRVDNGVRIFDLVTGSHQKLDYQELYSVVSLACNYEEGDLEKMMMQPQKKSEAATPTPIPGKYIPPSLRNSVSPSTGGSVAALKQALDANLPHIDNRPKPSKEENRIRRLQEKLDQIAELRDRSNRGETLELNQMEKLKSEGALRQEIQELKSKLNN